jgi:hypothetical protein
LCMKRLSRDSPPSFNAEEYGCRPVPTAGARRLAAGACTAHPARHRVPHASIWQDTRGAGAPASAYSDSSGGLTMIDGPGGRGQDRRVGQASPR